MKSNTLKNIIENEKRMAKAAGKGRALTAEEHVQLIKDRACERTYYLTCARHAAIHKLCETIRADNADLFNEIDAIQKDIEHTMWNRSTSDYTNWGFSRGRAIHSYIMPEIDVATKTMLEAIKNT